MRTTALLLALAALACTSTPPETHRYLLPAEVPTGTARIDPPVRIGLGRVSVPAYLAQPGLVVETDPGQVRAARQHVWAEPLESGLRRFLGFEISNALGQAVASDGDGQRGWATLVDVGVDRLHGTLGGEAVLVARWRVTEKGEPPVDHRFSATRPLPRAGYPGLFDAEVALLRELARAIAASL